MDNVLMYLLGFLTEEQWLQALGNREGANSKERVKSFAKDVYDYYPSLGWSDKTYQKLGIKTS